MEKWCFGIRRSWVFLHCGTKHILYFYYHAYFFFCKSIVATQEWPVTEILIGQVILSASLSGVSFVIDALWLVLASTCANSRNLTFCICSHRPFTGLLREFIVTNFSVLFIQSPKQLSKLSVAGFIPLPGLFSLWGKGTLAKALPTGSISWHYYILMSLLGVAAA